MLIFVWQTIKRCPFLFFFSSKSEFNRYYRFRRGIGHKEYNYQQRFLEYELCVCVPCTERVDTVRCIYDIAKPIDTYIKDLLNGMYGNDKYKVLYEVWLDNKHIFLWYDLDFYRSRNYIIYVTYHSKSEPVFSDGPMMRDIIPKSAYRIVYKSNKQNLNTGEAMMSGRVKTGFVNKVNALLLNRSSSDSLPQKNKKKKDGKVESKAKHSKNIEQNGSSVAIGRFVCICVRVVCV